MRFAINIPPFTAPATIVEMSRDAEAAGWDGVFLWDHLRWSPHSSPDVHDPWVLLGAIALATQRVRLGTLVTPLSRRRPWVVAKHVLTLDHLSHGRVIFGAGLGEPPEADFGAFGDAKDARVRAAILDEGLDILDQLMRTGHARLDGVHFHVDADILPAAVQQPRPPIWIAGVVPNQPPLRRARRWDGVVPMGTGESLSPDELAKYVGAVIPGWDVVAPWAPGVPAGEYQDAGATWLVDSTWPVGDWVGEFRDRIRRGPATD